MSSPLHTDFGKRVALTARTWRRAVDQRLLPFGLTEATWLPLVHLSRAAHPLRQKELATSLALDGSSVVRLIDALEQAGMVRRCEEDGDRRAKVIVLTDVGRDTVAQVEIVAKAVRDQALEGISDADIALAASVLDRVHAAVNALTEDGVK